MGCPRKANGEINGWRKGSACIMSWTIQLVSLFIFLAYSLAYALFVAWVSERADENHPRRPMRRATMALGAGLLLPGFLLLVSLC